MTPMPGDTVPTTSPDSPPRKATPFPDFPPLPTPLPARSALPKRGTMMLNGFSSSAAAAAPVDVKKMRFEERQEAATNHLTKDLLHKMVVKKSNLCVAADVTTTTELLRLAEQLGPHICILKLHVDIIEDFDPLFILELHRLAEKHGFLIFEDRKFADIGNTTSLQYAGGIYKIAAWANIVNAQSVPGDGVIKGLKDALRDKTTGALPYNRAMVLIAEMSSEGNLCTPEYREATVEMAERHADFVMGFISMGALSDNPAFLNMTPGIQFGSKGDALGQQYKTPEEAVAGGSDIIIVGRGIIKAPNPADAASAYKVAGWQAYEQRVGIAPAPGSGARPVMDV